MIVRYTPEAFNDSMSTMYPHLISITDINTTDREWHAATSCQLFGTTGIFNRYPSRAPKFTTESNPDQDDAHLAASFGKLSVHTSPATIS
ncbi:uncharacterized protein ARMOST_12997 [Armillaria ostoyae]|uniref:Uncharacterized protein n=1 Tax=Armillaria ostoyae TaxID=47428 RepID=A0A284RLI3_ARMOS|nr:uncharacterized protein ARMOST_12997 [Armillaria ostoyae]